jgi:hypothetical protein
MTRKTNKKSKSYEQKAGESVAITPVEYGSWQEAYDHFNHELFDGTLPDVMIVLQRRAHSGGHFAPNRYAGRGVNFTKHELSLNPDGFKGKSDEFICSILNHEMSHVWQEHCGVKRRKRYSYHDKEWAAKMKSIGLQPSNTGMVGGKETGVQMAHYIIDDGPFQIAFQKLAATGWRPNLESAAVPGPSGKPNKSKTLFTCQHCNWNVWGKPDTEVVCKHCALAVVACAEDVAMHAVLSGLLERFMMRTAGDAQSYDQAAE